MAKHFGDLPCAKINGVIHITVSGSDCLCGQGWNYADPFADKSTNLIWRTIEGVTCPVCKELWGKKNLKNNQEQ